MAKHRHSFEFIKKRHLCRMHRFFDPDDQKGMCVVHSKDGSLDHPEGVRRAQTGGLELGEERRKEKKGRTTPATTVTVTVLTLHVMSALRGDGGAVLELRGLEI